MYSPASLPFEHAPVASCSSKTKPRELEDSLLNWYKSTTIPPSESRDSLRRRRMMPLRRAVSVAELLVEAVNLFVNEKRIDLEIQAWTATISQFGKRTDQWLSVMCSINTAIKEIGDFEKWMKIMEFDSQSINAAIHNIHQA
ncbi:hypothetical protein D8674_006432 [Pyrus ussuriensis x Pyrus communis]|uniref:Biogenesis of lysosome-related organelles complex 1 subunit 1 n=1 Tax=Pyrus ussuriensis x Pyrus communis TaxID=2448454 RepID=A0A5N5FUA0_9ROSA|nr:hypothetical protein D8674_006432 [Pyrus ussuriensis x Pyrus communis]